MGGAEHLEEASYVRTLQTRTADMHDCQLGSVAQRARTGLPLTSKCPNAAPPPWGRPRGTFTSVITSPEQSAGWYALELYVRHACTPDASRAAHRRITAYARSTPSRAQVQRLGPVHGWASPLFSYSMVWESNSSTFLPHGLALGQVTPASALDKSRY